MSLHDAAENTQELLRALYRAEDLAALVTDEQTIPLILAVRMRTVRTKIKTAIIHAERIGLLLGERDES